MSRATYNSFKNELTQYGFKPGTRVLTLHTSQRALDLFFCEIPKTKAVLEVVLITYEQFSLDMLFQYEVVICDEFNRTQNQAEMLRLFVDFPGTVFLFGTGIGPEMIELAQQHGMQDAVDNKFRISKLWYTTTNFLFFRKSI